LRKKAESTKKIKQLLTFNKKTIKASSI